jgi:hypothetical protein
MLIENAPYIWGKADCSAQMWKLLNDLWPELKLSKWFKRTTAEAMAGWPWPALLSLDDTDFGDLLFANSTEDDPANRAPREQFKIKHVMMTWDEPETAIHAGKKRGFSKTNLKPFWRPRINLAIRPPY